MSQIPDARTTALQQLQQHSVGRRVTEIVREMIFDGQLAAGQRVPQDEIARDLGVSRLPVREALAGLELDGLVRLEKHRGAFVEPVLPDDIEDHYRVFGQTHGLAAARAAESATKQQVAALRAIHRELRAAESLDEQHRLNWEFHRQINLIGGSRRLRSIIGSLTRQIPRSFRFEIPPATPKALREHGAIVSAIAAGSRDRAYDACVTHLMTESDLIIALLRERGFFDHLDDVRVAT